MKSHGIDLIGPIKIEILSTLPNWTSNDEGREIYVEDEEKRYYGNSTQWVDYVFEHSIASHNDTSVTGSQLDADHSKLSGIEESADVNNISDENATDLTDGGDTTLHDHDGIDENTNARHAESHSVASHNDTTATGAELETLTNNSIANTLHRHSELVASDGDPDPAFSINAAGYAYFPIGTGVNEFSTDDTLGGNSDNAVPTEKAVKTYVTNNIPASSPSMPSLMMPYTHTELTRTSQSWATVFGGRVYVPDGHDTLKMSCRIKNSSHGYYSYCRFLIGALISSNASTYTATYTWFDTAEDDYSSLAGTWQILEVQLVAAQSGHTASLQGLAFIWE